MSPSSSANSNSGPGPNLNSSSASSQGSNRGSQSTQLKTLLLVTEVPFWRQQTGAHQRILSLVQYLVDQGWQVSCVYVGSLLQVGTAPTSNPDRESIERLKLHVHSLIDDWRPQGLSESILWKLRCIANSLAGKLWPQRSKQNFSSAPSSHQQSLHRNSKRLVDFEDAELKRRFTQLIRQLRPEVVIVEYLTLCYLLPPKQNRAGVRYWVDTHDLLSSRCAQLQQQGLCHWIEISPAEEAEALKTFDGIIAIEATEADQFRSMTGGQVPVVVAGFAATRTTIPAGQAPVNATQVKSTSRSANADAGVSIGLIASDNAINLAGLQWFLDKVWPSLNSSNMAGNANPSIKLVLAGSLSKHPSVAGRKAENLICLGLVDDLREFYDQIQIAINPVQFGTGLKIKSVEALSYGKPLIADRHSIRGLPAAGPEPPFLAVDSAEQMIKGILSLSQDPTLLAARTEAAQRYAETFCSAAIVYGELFRILDSTSVAIN